MSAHPIHHVTAVTANIGENLRFYTKVLGLRLVKRSVNQDDVSAYHLFYADEVGSPGTDITFFDWPTMPPNVPGLASVALTRFRVHPDSIGYWEERVRAEGCESQNVEDEAGRPCLRFADHEGQRLELVGHSQAGVETHPWTEAVPEPYAIRGILGVDLASARPEATEAVLTQLLGYSSAGGGVFRTEGDDADGEVRIVSSGEEKITRLGSGGVHHVAFRVKDDEELKSVMGRVEEAGLRTSGYVDRFYFHSVYFREPGGVLFELATDGPGFASDEDAKTLGQHLALPPFLEPHRERIEAGLKPLPALE